MDGCGPTAVGIINAAMGKFFRDLAQKSKFHQALIRTDPGNRKVFEISDLILGLPADRVSLSGSAKLVKQPDDVALRVGSRRTPRQIFGLRTRHQQHHQTEVSTGEQS